MLRGWLIASTICLAAAATLAGPFDYEEAPISYSAAIPTDPVAQLQQRIEKKQVTLSYHDDRGFLDSMLKELNVPKSSQMLVFSKTSFQRTLISPRNPRALFFNDDVYVGYVPGGEVLEISAVDPQLGAVFYTLSQEKPTLAHFVRQTHACLQCHDSSSMTGGIPGHIVRSVFPDSNGLPILQAGTFRINHTSPLKERWGGWYVTGQHGKQRHMGNVLSPERDDVSKFDVEQGANVTSLSELLDTSGYPSPGSDIVALMVMEHQTQMHNLIARANYLTRMALHDEQEISKALGRPAGKHSDSTLGRVKSACEPLVEYLLFSGEARLTDHIEGTSTFAEEFSGRGPTDAKGRSLRQFDLNTRLFKYPCSYIIYSKAFDGLPKIAREQVYRRLGEILKQTQQSAKFAHLTSEDRAAIREILIQTKPDTAPFLQD